MRSGTRRSEIDGADRRNLGDVSGRAGPSDRAGRSVHRGPLPVTLDGFNDAERQDAEPVPWLAALVCASAFDLAVHDAYGVLHGVPTYETYNARIHERGPGRLSRARRRVRCFLRGRYPEDFLVYPRPETIPAWHLVGGKDPIDAVGADRRGTHDGYPVLLRDWIRRDGLKCLKVKLRGDDAAWDYDRLVRVGNRPSRKGSLADSRLQLHGARAGLRQ